MYINVIFCFEPVHCMQHWTMFRGGSVAKSRGHKPWFPTRNPPNWNYCSGSLCSAWTRPTFGGPNHVIHTPPRPLASPWSWRRDHHRRNARFSGHLLWSNWGHGQWAKIHKHLADASFFVRGFGLSWNRTCEKHEPGTQAIKIVSTARKKQRISFLRTQEQFNHLSTPCTTAGPIVPEAQAPNGTRSCWNFWPYSELPSWRECNENKPRRQLELPGEAT